MISKKLGSSILKSALIIAMVTVIFQNCKKTFPKPVQDDETLDGPIAGLTASENKAFLEGAAHFDQIFTASTGLGPIYVQSSCATCHAAAGKGHLSTRLIRFNKKIPGGYDPMTAMGGPQLQNLSLPGYPAESLPMGYTGLTKFVAPAITGLGYLEAVEDSTLLALSDPLDKDGDGISGQPNWIAAPDYFEALPWHVKDIRGYYIGRFGRKAGNLNMLMQSVNALHEDMGITTDFHSYDLYNYLVGKGSGDNVPEPELPSSSVHSLVYYLQTFKSPIQRNTQNADVLKGFQLFEQIGCNKCHTSTIQTGYHPLSVLANKTIHPYTDLLMHDMGPGLDDGYAEGNLESFEWRTTPLWGLGLSKVSQGGKYFLMHDGRAHSINDAILLHGGESKKSSDGYAALCSGDKANLITFLESL